MEIRSSVDDACRLCLRGEGKISVFEDDLNNRTITPENIYDCVSIKITKDDRLPKGICESCVQSVESWCSFKSTCDETQKTLQGWLLCDNLGQGSEKMNACFPTQKEEIKNSSCNTYKIIDGLEESGVRSSPYFSPQIQTDLHDSEFLKHSSDEVRNSGYPENIKCNDAHLPSLNESIEPTVPCGQKVEELPCTESQSTLSVVDSKSSLDETGDLSVNPEGTDTSESYSASVNIVDIKSYVVHNLNEIKQDEEQKETNNQSCECDGSSETPKSPISDNREIEKNDPESNSCPSSVKSEKNDPESNSCPLSVKSEFGFDKGIVHGFSDTSCQSFKEDTPCAQLHTFGSSNNTVKATVNSQDVKPRQESLDKFKLEYVNGLLNSHRSLLDSKDNDIAENGESNIASDVLSEIQEKIVSLSPNIQDNYREDINTTILEDQSKTVSTDLSADSDANQNHPNESDVKTSLEKSECNNESLLAPDIEENDNSVEGDGLSFPEIRIESTSTLTEDILYSDSFSDNNNGMDVQNLDQDIVRSTESTSNSPVEIENCPNYQISENLTSIPPSQTDPDSSAPVNSTEGSAEEKEISQENSPSPATSVSVTQKDQPDEPSESGNSSSEHLKPQEPSTEAGEPAPESRTESEFSSTVALNIKQEPVDPPPEEDNPTEEVHYRIRVKSEYSTFDYEEDLEDYETIDGRAEQTTSSDRVLPNTECHVCNRRYASVSNFLKHLQTKVHLHNAGLTEYPHQVVGGDESRDSPMLRSRLSGEPLNAGSFEEHPLPPDTPPTSSSSYAKRKGTEYCDLCNTSFGYVSELKRHLLSKKHRENERFLKHTQSPAKKLAMSKSPPLSDSRSIFICPIEKCNFSCIKGVSLLNHMKIHGIEQPPESRLPEEAATTRPKLSARQQDILKKEAEKRKLAQQQLQQQELQIQQQQILHQQQQQQLQQQQLHHQQFQQQQLQQHQLQLQYQFQQNLVEEDYPGEFRHDFECKGCHKTFLRESGLRKHGHYCSALTANDLEEESKQEEESTETKNSVISQKMHCPLCDLSFASRSVFVSHVQIYHKGSNLENGLLKPYKKPSVIQVSNKLRVNNKKGLGFVCNICGKKFNLLSSLNFHLKTHSVSVKHICRICKEGFNVRKAFMEHCRTHFLKAGSKETLCHKCFKVFKTRSELYYHRKNDMCSIKLKIYSCNLCQHSFKEPSALEEHRVVFHSESLDMSEDAVNSSSVGELYDDNFIPLNPLSLVSPANENLPGTSSKPAINYNNKNVPNYSHMNYSSKNSMFNNKINSINYTTKSSGKSPFHCEICATDYATKQTLKKHIKKFHILNAPYMGSKRYSSFRKGNIHQANSLKQWKCKHCKTAFGSRKMLVLHLKKCQYNVLDIAKGMCLQCGKWCESGKTRICRFCLPDLTKAPKPQNSNFTEGPKFSRPDYPNFETYKQVKQEYLGHQIQENSNEDFLDVRSSTPHYSEFSPFQNQQLLGYSPETFPVTIKSERKEGQKQMGANHQKTSAKQDGTVNMSNIRLMKCPIGNKYFRNEMTMIKHYSQCDGSCENRCSHCRKMFNSPKEYRLHLINSKCFGPRRRDSRKKYPSFGSKRKYCRASMKQDLSIASMDITSKFPGQRLNEDERIDKMPDDSSDITIDMSALESTISEESSIGPESTVSSSANRLIEEKSLKIGRVCTMCDKVITMQRAIYRHVYGCFKIFMLSQESVSCKKCNKTFSKHGSMKDNTAAIKQHVLSCHFIPYYIGEGLQADGSRVNMPPQLLCYVCSFGFSSNASLQKHIKEHRNRKDETNNVVLQLEEELISDERLADEESMFSLYVEPKNTNVFTVRNGRTLSLQDTPTDGSIPRPGIPGRKYFQCDKCSRSFTNRNKFLRHKKVHGIVKESVFHEVTDNVVEFMSDNVPLNN